MNVKTSQNVDKLHITSIHKQQQQKKIEKEKKRTQ